MGRQILIIILIIFLVALVFLKKKSDQDNKSKKSTPDKKDSKEPITPREIFTLEDDSILDKPDIKPNNMPTNHVEIGRFIQERLRNLSRDGLLPDEMIENLLDKTYCADYFNLSYPVLKLAKKEEAIENQIYFEGIAHYWANTVNLNSNNYYVYKKWDRVNRVYFEMWFRELSEPIIYDKNKDISEEEEEKIKISNFVREELINLSREEYLEEKDIVLLKNNAMCIRVFDIKGPVLVEVDEYLQKDEQIKINGQTLYMEDPIEILDTKYYVYSYWEPKSKKAFKDWLSELYLRLESVEMELLSESFDFKGYVRNKFVYFFNNKIINEKMIGLLQNGDYSRIVLRIKYPAIKKYDPSVDIEQQILVDNEIRYWDEPLNYNGTKFLLYRDWIEEENKNHFDHWSMQWDD